jgi:hypothetical protein
MLANPHQLLPQWIDLDVMERALETEHFIVFVNMKGNCDYKTSDAYDTAGAKDPAKHGRMMSEATEIENLDHGFLSEENKIAFKKLICEGIARSLEHEYTAAKAAYQAARSYLERRQNQKSRQWYLSAAVVVSLILIVPFLLYTSDMTLQDMSPRVRDSIYVECGFVGALFSIILRMGKTSFDFGADRALHYWEAGLRIVAGGIAAMLIMLAVKAKILLANFVTADNEIYTLMFICICAGALEKWVPSLIASVGKQKLDMSTESSKDGK